MRRAIHDNINTEKYWDEFHGSDKSAEGLDWLKNSIIANHIVDGSRVLELGCGVGWLLSRIATQNSHCELVGVEFTESAIKRLSEDRRIKVIKADLTKDFSVGQEESFDYVICSEVLEHLENPTKLVEKISKFLAKGGVAIITTPYGDHIPSPEHIWEFSVEDVEKMMEGNFSQYYVYLWASGLGVHEVTTGKTIYPPGHLDVIWAIGFK